MKTRLFAAIAASALLMAHTVRSRDPLTGKAVVVEALDIGKVKALLARSSPRPKAD
jgi:hypothetical protein